MSAEFAIPEIVRRRASNLGEEGLAWLRALDEGIADLAREWDISIGAVMQGGSEAFVAEATAPDGRQLVLKIGVPGSESGGQEARVLLAAAGRGYAQIFRYDESRRAMLLERLGARLDEMGLSVDAQIGIICATLKTAWRRPPADLLCVTGEEKAESLAAFIAELWGALGRPCSERSIDRAMLYARRRSAAFSTETSVLAHGDAHAANTLSMPGSSESRFKFIDPDGLFIEPAYDLAVCMRGWGAALLAGDAFALGRQRANLLSMLTGVEPEPIWEWGLIERVSTGLLLKQLGRDDEAAEYLAVAELWAAEDDRPA